MDKKSLLKELKKLNKEIEFVVVGENDMDIVSLDVSDNVTIEMTKNEVLSSLSWHRKTGSLSLDDVRIIFKDSEL